MEPRYRIEYWVQDTIESGHWELTGLMTKENAEKCLAAHIFCQGRIMEDTYYV